jgi:cyanophycinase
MAGTIILAGGEEFRVGCEDMDREVMRASGKDPASVIIIPTAAVTGPAKAANDGVTHFAALGGTASQLMVLEKSHANDQKFIEPTQNADVVYFTGGNPDHLLSTLTDSMLLRLLKDGLERGLVLGGSSAGAMVMGSVMRRPPLYSGPEGGDGQNRWVEGLGIAPGICVLPHHERRNPAEVSSELRQTAPEGVVYLGIDARTGVLGSPDNWRVWGFGRVVVYRANDYDVFASGERLPTGF